MTPAGEDGSSARPPQHPVPQLQGAFEESMMESLNGWEDGEKKIDPVARRKLLLQGDRYERVCAGRWKQRPGEKFHPLWKLSAQLSFGIHLLAQGLAESEEEVMSILLSHVDDIDGFLERTTEDFDLAQTDVDERLHHLQLPLEHLDLFDQMLEDKAFRTSIVEGNEKIEHIVERTTEAMQDALKDVQKGIDATGALGKYLISLKSNWNSRTPEVEAVYVTMLGNVEGWTAAFMDLYIQGNRLAVTLLHLAGIVAEMQRRAGVASRKVLLPYNASTNMEAPGVQGVVTQKEKIHHPRAMSSRSARPANQNPQPIKPLPVAPDLMAPARQASKTKIVHEGRLRRRSLEVSRDEERVKATQAQPEGKASVAAKFRSVTKSRPAQTPSGKAKSQEPQKPSEARFAVFGKKSSAALRSPQGPGRRFASQLPTLIGIEEHTSQSFRGPELDRFVELSADTPHNGPGTLGTPKKGGLHLNLGSNHRHIEHGSGLSSSKSFNIFRRSPPSTQPVEAMTESYPAQRVIQSQRLAKPFSNCEDFQQMEIQSSPLAATPPRCASPNPALPTPSAFGDMRLAQSVDANAYVALPNVFATAQRASGVKAPLRVSIPSSADAELQKTPRAARYQPADPVLTEDVLAEPPFGLSETQQTQGNDLEYAPPESSIARPGSKVPTVRPSQASEQPSTTAEDGEKTPTAVAMPRLDLSIVSSGFPQQLEVEPVETPLTSATMRSFSDFYKLPPQHTSPTPPPTTPEGWATNQSTASSVALSINHSRGVVVQEVDTKGEPGTVKPDEKPIPTGSAQPFSTPVENTVMDPKHLSLPPREDGFKSQSKLLDMIASTPPHSSNHTRASSDAGIPPAVGMTSFASRIIAPPEEAAPGPAPDGRGMMVPDNGSANDLDRERKTQRISGMRTDGLKGTFKNGESASAASGGNSFEEMSVGEKGRVDEEVHLSANLMGGEGSDLLWYKSMGRDGLWVSGA